MDQRLTFLTLGVNDLKQMTDFYKEKFGWTPAKDDNGDGIVFFKLNGFMFALYPVHELAEDVGVAQDGKGFRRVALAINCRSEEEVNKTFDELRKKNVKIVREPEKVFWGGYRGYVADVEDNYWEIAFNPFMELDADGNVK